MREVNRTSRITYRGAPELHIEFRFDKVGNFFCLNVTKRLFTRPTQKVTEDYITGRFG